MMTYEKEIADTLAKISTEITTKYNSLVRMLERKHKIVDLWKINSDYN